VATFAEDMAEAVAGWTSLSGPQAVRELIESLPDGIEALANGLRALHEHLGELAGDQLLETANEIYEMTLSADVLKTGADLAAENFGEESAFWMSDGD
jgi:plasmid stabilization system protein ParE